MIRRAAIGLLVCCPALAGVLGGGGFGDPQPAVPNPKSEIRKPRDYAPGVRIDWGRQVVEVDAVVVLREGPLELLACSPNTREHESILVVQARPIHIYQAMGLIGLQPGSPVRYDPNTSRSYAPTGESLDLRVRYRQRSIEKTVKAEQWLLDNERGQLPKSVEWVFAGSRTLDDGRFGADQDGTVVCVVDFATALITVGSLHTADNEFLWLSANTTVIPPIGTHCTLLIRSATERTFAIVLDVAADGTLWPPRVRSSTASALDSSTFIEFKS